MEQKIPGISKNFRETDNRLSTYLILYRKFRLIAPLNLENTSGRKFDWSMETMVP